MIFLVRNNAIWNTMTMDIYSEYGFAFPAHKASTKTTIHELTDSHVHCHGIPNSIISIQKNH